MEGCCHRLTVAQLGWVGDFKLVMIQSRKVSPLRRQSCLNPVWLGGLRSSASLRSPSDRLVTYASPPAKLYFDDSWRTKPAGLIESCK